MIHGPKWNGVKSPTTDRKWWGKKGQKFGLDSEGRMVKVFSGNVTGYKWSQGGFRSRKS